MHVCAAFLIPLVLEVDWGLLVLGMCARREGGGLPREGSWGCVCVCGGGGGGERVWFRLRAV